jgi:hypothetical protein
MPYSYVVGGEIQLSNIVFPAKVAGVYYSSPAVTPNDFYPEVDVIPTHNSLTQDLAFSGYSFDTDHVNILYSAVDRSVEAVTRTRQIVVDAIEAHHDVISKQAVTVGGIDYKGGWESATVIKGCADTVQELDGTTCGIVNTVGAEQTLTIAQTRDVAVGISLAYQATFSAKTAALIAAATASNEIELNAALTTFADAYPA